ncbi:hypothetical protein Nepgr_016621 [Nepenthes gracilis]|uniref:Uncharacterized protein n=1 Tax=Nepenthes gracilis TaxID=150966 RepID=A0AAD3SMZ8_NEPGR|nr:hypothetical protein Nepgr_016621 [Nepenthes gracilis]
MKRGGSCFIDLYGITETWRCTRQAKWGRFASPSSPQKNFAVGGDDSEGMVSGMEGGSASIDFGIESSDESKGQRWMSRSTKICATDELITEIDPATTSIFCRRIQCRWMFQMAGKYGGNRFETDFIGGVR